MNKVEVDMVPLIDIISLLLMFLIIVGDTSANSTSVRMKLPSASEAKQDWGESKNRIVLQMKLEDGRYFAVFNNRSYDMGGALKERLAQTISDAAGRNEISKRDDGSWAMPVKLRIPEECPMNDVEKLLATVAGEKLTDVQYAVRTAN